MVKSCQIPILDGSIAFLDGYIIIMLMYVYGWSFYVIFSRVESPV